MKIALLLLLLLSTPLAWAAEAPSAAPAKAPSGVPADAKPFKGHWYRVYNGKGSWHNAKGRCTALGGRLAIVPDAATWTFIKTLSKSSLWLGATDEAKEGEWKWIDGTPVTFAAWVTNNPNNQGGNENYLAMVVNDNVQGWNDFSKEGKTNTLQISGFICEWVPK